MAYAPTLGSPNSDADFFLSAAREVILGESSGLRAGDAAPSSSFPRLITAHRPSRSRMHLLRFFVWAKPAQTDHVGASAAFIRKA